MEKYVIKTSGEEEKFDKNKIVRTIVRAGGSKELATDVAERIEKKSKDHVSTVKILRNVLKLLKNQKTIAIMYNLKNAIMNLGPDGYFFEEYFSRILQEYGYKTRNNQILKGKVITQEVDIIAIKNKVAMIECKYHNNPGGRADSKEAMYTYARFLDLNSTRKRFDYPWLVTNTKCTPHAEGYAEGVGLKITGWGYPKDESLQFLIENKRLYPVTMVPSVDRYTKQVFHENKIVLIKDLFKKTPKELSKETDIPLKKLDRIITEAKEVLD